jgi:hypothetical protein
MKESASEMIPMGLDTMEPGPYLAVILASIDVTNVSDYDRIVVLRAHQRMASHYAARVYEDMASVTSAMPEANDRPDMAAEFAAAEIRAALHLTRRSADVELAFALELQERLPRLASMLGSGELDVRRAKTIERGTTHLTPTAARAIVDRVAEIAPRLTSGELAARIRRLCIDIAPGDAEERYARSVSDRRVVMEATEAGTANLLGFNLPPGRVAAVTRRINMIARSLRGRGEARTMDQLRSDVFLDLLLGGQRRGTGGGAVDIRVDLDTLACLVDHAGDLGGYGPVIADMARQVADEQERAEWRFTVTDTKTAEAVLTGTTRRRHTASQRRAIESRAPTCVFPGCRMPAAACDIDHRIPWARGGATSLENGHPLCRHDHRIRHDAGWTYRRLSDGTYRWVSRLGHVYITGGTPP